MKEFYVNLKHQIWENIQFYCEKWKGGIMHQTKTKINQNQTY